MKNLNILGRYTSSFACMYLYKIYGCVNIVDQKNNDDNDEHMRMMILGKRQQKLIEQPTKE